MSISFVEFVVLASQETNAIHGVDADKKRVVKTAALSTKAQALLTVVWNIGRWLVVGICIRVCVWGFVEAQRKVDF